MPNSPWRAAAFAAVFILSPAAEGGPAGTAVSAGNVRELFAGAPIERLTLDQAISLALQNNLEARIDRIDIRVHRSRVRFEAGAFDPALSLNYTHNSVRRPENINDIRSADVLRQDRQVSAIEENTNAIRSLQGLPPLTRADTTGGFGGVTFDQQTVRSGASAVSRTPWGMRYGFFAEANRLRSTFTGDQRDIIPEYQTSVGIQVVQPLLKDFGPGANLAPLRIARIQERISVLNWRQRVMTSVQAVMSTFYDMQFGASDLAVRQDAIDAAEKLVQQNQRRFELGFMSPFDVQQARAQVSLDREQLLSSKNFFMERQFAMKRLLSDEYESDDGRVFLPAAIPPLATPTLNRSALLADAFARRYDYQAALLEADAQDIRLRFARNQALPQLDLVGTYGLNGLADNYGDAFRQSFRGSAPEWSLGVNLRIPLGNVQGRANVDQALAQKEQTILRIKQIEITVGVDVDTVISRIETNRQRVDTARNTRELNEEAVRIAYRRLEEGQVSSFDVIEQQRLLYDARSRELAAQAELNKSITQLWLATGTILERTNVQFAPDRRGTRELPKVLGTDPDRPAGSRAPRLFRYRPEPRR